MNGEWTHEKLQGLLQISNEDRYVADHAFENTLDEINSALAAERKKLAEANDMWDRASRQADTLAEYLDAKADLSAAQQQLAAAVEALKTIHGDDGSNL